jgi:hypothetical protein
VFVGRMPATVIPRRFLSTEDAEELRTFLAQRELIT